MFLNPHTNRLFSTLRTWSLESDTALKLWLALQQTPSRSPRACSQRIGLFCFWANSLASASEENQWTWSVSLATFFSTTALGTVAPVFLVSTPVFGAGLFFPPSAGAAARASNKAPVINLYRMTYLRSRAFHLPLDFWFLCLCCFCCLADSSWACRTSFWAGAGARCTRAAVAWTWRSCRSATASN